jgi:hypothetical protein
MDVTVANVSNASVDITGAVTSGDFAIFSNEPAAARHTRTMDC